ncbi:MULTISPECIES: hypothetical protein [Ralstonia solanacearum species complex]|uniref:hypothetical protein n=1 Tax=Ralstonia solanacearum species complex TaxID=3116862 RepID=UPI0012FD5546|nr:MULTISPECIES: hypothetical protein [Ralstonia solanacearum species complex]
MEFQKLIYFNTLWRAHIQTDNNKGSWQPGAYMKNPTTQWCAEKEAVVQRRLRDGVLIDYDGGRSPFVHVAPIFKVQTQPDLTGHSATPCPCAEPDSG